MSNRCGAGRQVQPRANMAVSTDATVLELLEPQALTS
jgi:hypothetical protein